MIKYVILILFILQFGIDYAYAQHKSNDLIDELIVKSKDENLSLDERLKHALHSSELAKETNIDSVILKTNRNLSLRYFQSGEYEKYISLNRSNFELARKIKDSSALTIAASNLGSLYRYFYKNDSSYYFYSQALKYYPQNEISEAKATALLYMADIQQIEKIYAGAEEAAIKSIIILNRLPETQNRLDKLWNAYNLMGIISRELGNYSKALEYYDKSNEYAKRIDDGFINEVYSINNKAYVYRQMGNFEKAINLYESLIPLRSKYEEKDPTFYPTIIDNIADTQLESGKYDFDSVRTKFMEAYTLANKLDDEVLKMNIAIDISKLYSETNQLDSIRKYAEEALSIATKVTVNEVKQKALLLLAKVNPGETGKYYLKEHIRITDSLLNAERKVRNKYARIEFETDELEAENEKIEAKNKQISKENLYLLILSIGLLLTAILIYVVISQRAKNRKLELMQVQQKANEDIYNLMLGQQDKVDEARAKEKTRISEELHDSVLSNLFGTRLSLDSINFNEGKEAMMNRAKYISQLHGIEQEIRKISHELNADFIAGTGFMDIVTELIETQTQAYNLDYDFKFTDDITWDLVPNKTKINIYRIIQESMQNIHKHANAKSIKISISLEKGLICLEIIDDGEGFDTSRNKKGIGLKNMKSRVEDINGEISFSSQSGKGTIVHVKIPYVS